MTPELADAVERVWPGRGARFEVLGGGITNHNVKVDVDGETYVLRVAGHDTELLGIDRGVEHAASVAAATIGVGPEVVAFVEPEGWLVTRFIDGVIPPAAALQEPATIARVGAALRLVHGGPVVSSRFDSFRVVEDYLDTALARGADVPDWWDWAHGIAARIELARAGAPRRLCHNDLLRANFIDDGKQLRIVDWEYAGMGDPFFDLANYSINLELDVDQRRLLLEAYAGGADAEDLDALELMRFMSDFREAMWGVVQAVVSALDFDFAGYAADHFARLHRTEADAPFRAALGSGPRRGA